MNEPIRYSLEFGPEQFDQVYDLWVELASKDRSVSLSSYYAEEV